MSKSIRSWQPAERMEVIRHRLKECRGTSIDQSGLGFWGAVDALKHARRSPDKSNLGIGKAEAEGILEGAK